ncbi:hypothetical protein Hdeb2414_s0001g00016421 [Helianthus debilis subsp. tardiflorus]
MPTIRVSISNSDSQSPTEIKSNGEYGSRVRFFMNDQNTVQEVRLTICLHSVGFLALVLNIASCPLSLNLTILGIIVRWVVFIC